VLRGGNWLIFGLFVPVTELIHQDTAALLVRTVLCLYICMLKKWLTIWQFYICY